MILGDIDKPKRAQGIDPHISGYKKNIRALLPRHFKVIEMVLAGHSIGTIAKATSMTGANVRLVTRSPLFQAELVRQRERSGDVEIMEHDKDAIRGKARLILEQATEKAAETVVELLDADNENVKLKASSNILDRALGTDRNTSPIIQIDADSVQLIHLTLEELRNAQDAEQPANETDAETQEGELENVYKETPSRLEAS